MDLEAYASIERLKHLVEKNNIKIPRLRGYRLMLEEEPIYEDFEDLEAEECEQLIRAFKTDKKVDKYIKNDKVLWNKIHGKFRKNLKFAIKRKKKAIKKQYETFNKYVGRKDIMMVHARVGGDNWDFFDCHKTVATQPWFVEKVDDYYDNTYCDIYCKLSQEGDC